MQPRKNYKYKAASSHYWWFTFWNQKQKYAFFPIQRFLNFKLTAKHVAAPALPISRPGSVQLQPSRLLLPGSWAWLRKNPLTLFTGTVKILCSPTSAGSSVELAVFLFVPSQLCFRFPWQLFQTINMLNDTLILSRCPCPCITDNIEVLSIPSTCSLSLEDTHLVLLFLLPEKNYLF